MRRTVVLAAALSAGAGAPAADAAGLRLTTRSTVADPGALPARCAATGATAFAQLAVDTADPRRLTVVWTSDGMRGAGASVSADRGRTWRSEPVPGATRCTGAPEQQAYAANPRIAGGLGRTWFGASWISDDDDVFSTFGTRVHVRDGDGWRTPAPIVAGPAQNVAVVPDLARRDDAVGLTVRFDQPPLVPTAVRYAPTDSVLVASRTQDAGRTWSPAAPVHPPTPDRYDVEVQAVRLGDGSVLAVWNSAAKQELFTSAAGSPVSFPLRAARSVDGGHTWSAPVSVGAANVLESLKDPEGSATVGVNVKFDLAARPSPGSRQALLAFGTGTSAVSLRTDDGGATWSAPRRLDRGARVHSVDAAVDGAGREALFFYDFVGDRPGDAALTTTARLAVLGATPRIYALAPSFDSRRARVAGLPYDGDLPVGVTQSVEGLPRGFAAAFTVAPPVTVSPTTVRFAVLEPRRRSRRGR